MRQKNRLHAFTLIEIIVGVSILSILALGASTLNFSRLNQNQKISIEAVKIVNIFEEARNNALIGRGIGANLTTPESWRVDISETGSGSISTYYTFDGSIWIPYDLGKWSTIVPFSLTNITCKELIGSSTTSLTGSSISFSGDTGSIIGCGDDKKLSFDFGSTGSYSKNISINVLTGVIELD